MVPSPKKPTIPSKPVPLPKSKMTAAQQSACTTPSTPVTPRQQIEQPKSPELPKLLAATPRPKLASMTNGNSVLPNDVQTTLPRKPSVIPQPTRTDGFERVDTQDNRIVGKKSSAYLLREADREAELALFGKPDDTTGSENGSDSSEVVTKTGEFRLRKKYTHTFPVWDMSAEKRLVEEKGKEKEKEEPSLLD